MIKTRKAIKMEQLKIVQIDLARQKENLPEIFRFFEFVKKYGYNAVALYLEDRIRTKTYPYASDSESYTEKEIGEIVDHADKLGLELIPVVSNFAHAERFLQHEELLHIAELRGGDGFYPQAVKITACPKLPASQAFFDVYFAEVAALFPKSRYFHAGLDEDFDIGSCELCKADFKEHGGMGHLFLNHVKRTNEVINAFGKEMMMWDDMLVYCPEIIPEIPKNVIMCSWCYDYIDLYPRSPFANSKQTDIFAEYDKYGIRYMPAVWCNFAHNVDTYTKYANEHSPIGYYNTTWGMSEDLLLFVYPLIAYTGKLWNGELVDDPTERLRAVAREVLGAEDPTDVAILAKAIEKPTLNNRVSTYFLHGTVVRRNVNFEDEYKDICFLSDLLSQLKVDNDYVKAIKYRIARSKLTYEAMIVAQDLIDFEGGVYKTDVALAKEKLLKIKSDFTREFDCALSLWKKYRGGISEEQFDEATDRVFSDLDKLTERAENAKFADSTLLNVQYLLPEKTVYGRVITKITYTDGTVEEIPGGIVKPYASACYNIADKGPYFYIFSRLINKAKVPQSVEISTAGVGNVCIQYVMAIRDGVKYLPTSVATYGKYTENPEHLLINDTRWATIGDYSMLDGMTVLGRREERSGIIVTLSEQ